MPASRGTFQDPQGKESPTSRIQRHPEVQLNGATQQLAFLSRDFSKYLIAAQYLGLHTNTHTDTHRLARSQGFYHHNSYCLRTVKMLHISIHSGTVGRSTAEQHARCFSSTMWAVTYGCTSGSMQRRYKWHFFSWKS